MEYPKIVEILEPEEWATDDRIAELVVYEKIIETYMKVLLICGLLLFVTVIF